MLLSDSHELPLFCERSVVIHRYTRDSVRSLLGRYSLAIQKLKLFKRLAARYYICIRFNVAVEHGCLNVWKHLKSRNGLKPTNHLGNHVLFMLKIISEVRFCKPHGHKFILCLFLNSLCFLNERLKCLCFCVLLGISNVSIWNRYEYLWRNRTERVPLGFYDKNTFRVVAFPINPQVNSLGFKISVHCISLTLVHCQNVFAYISTW